MTDNHQQQGSAGALHAALPLKSLLSAIVDSSSDAIFSTSLDGTITSWNRAAERIFGCTADEILGRSVLTLVPRHLASEESHIVDQVRKEVPIEHFESFRLRKDGTMFPVALSASPIRSDNGEIIGVAKVIRDITGQRHMHDAAYLLAAIVESSDDAIVSKTLDGIITSWNAAAERVFGYSAAEIIGQSVLRLIPPELQEEEPVILARMRAGERMDRYETVRVRKDGTRIDVSLTISPIKDEKGRVIGASKIARDISQQRKADHSTRLLAAIVDSSDDAIVSKNLQGIVTSWNAGAQRIFGYTAEEMVGRPIATLFPPDRLNEEPMILERLKRGERVDHYQTVRVRKGGEMLHVSLTISPIRDASGRVVGASKIARDITAQQKAMEQLERANDELKRADQMKSEFLAVMSHELRTPLNSIIGFTGVLRQCRQGPLTDEQKKLLGLISTSGKHLLHLINEVLDLSRIEAGRMDIEPESFSLAELVEEAIRTVELQANQKGLKLRRQIDVEGPVFTDRKRLFQVVLNLLNNGVKFTPAGSVTIKAWREEECLLVRVEDTGIGIPKEKHPLLFKAFSQIESSSRRRFEGTGLGLYLCRKIAALLGGEITMQSEPGRGSIFTLHVPLTAQPATVSVQADLANV